MTSALEARASATAVPITPVEKRAHVRLVRVGAAAAAGERVGERRVALEVVDDEEHGERKHGGDDHGGRPAVHGLPQRAALRVAVVLLLLEQEPLHGFGFFVVAYLKERGCPKKAARAP